eukprot:GDKJ01012591.1.p1 GENE.GDKJ01012591.1~~GDKJ01012591.1.p1  ORF type:complete len:755 (+),score=160.70 GDKJ01012591.1:183-2267(+)
MDQISGVDLTRFTHQIGRRAGVEIPVMNFHKRANPEYKKAITKPTCPLSENFFKNERPTVDISQQFKELVTAFPDLNSNASIPQPHREDNRSSKENSRTSTPQDFLNLSPNDAAQIQYETSLQPKKGDSNFQKKSGSVSGSSSSQKPPVPARILSPTSESLHQLSVNASSSHPSNQAPLTLNNQTLGDGRGVLISRQSPPGTPYDVKQWGTRPSQLTNVQVMMANEKKIPNMATSSENGVTLFPIVYDYRDNKKVIDDEDNKILIPYRMPRNDSEIPVNGSCVDSHYPDEEGEGDNNPSSLLAVTAVGGEEGSELPSPRDYAPGIEGNKTTGGDYYTDHMTSQQRADGKEKNMNPSGLARLKRLTEWMKKNPLVPTHDVENDKFEKPFGGPSMKTPLSARGKQTLAQSQNYTSNHDSKAVTEISYESNGLATDWPKPFKVKSSPPETAVSASSEAPADIPHPPSARILEQQAFANLLNDLHIEARATLQPLFTPRDPLTARTLRPLSATTGRRRDAAPSTHSFTLKSNVIDANGDVDSNKEVAYALVSTEKKRGKVSPDEEGMNKVTGSLNITTIAKRDTLLSLEKLAVKPGQQNFTYEEWRSINYFTGNMEPSSRNYKHHEESLPGYWEEKTSARRFQRIYNTNGDALISSRREKENVHYDRINEIGWKEVCKQERKARGNRGREWPSPSLQI